VRTGKKGQKSITGIIRTVSEMYNFFCKIMKNKVLRRIIGPRREDDGVWRKLRNDELQNVYSSPSIVRVIKSRRMRWAWHGWGQEVCTGYWSRHVKGADLWGDLDVDGGDIIRWNLWEIGVEGDWILLAQDRDRWRVLVNSVMNIQVR
jgi:hypothetical protein